MNDLIMEPYSTSTQSSRKDLPWVYSRKFLKSSGLRRIRRVERLLPSPKSQLHRLPENLLHLPSRHQLLSQQQELPPNPSQLRLQWLCRKRRSQLRFQKLMWLASWRTWPPEIQQNLIGKHPSLTYLNSLTWKAATRIARKWQSSLAALPN